MTQFAKNETGSPRSEVGILRGRVPTEKQYGTLRNLASGAAGLSWGKRHTEPFLRRGWVTAEWRPPYYQWVRITPAGLRALADAVEKFGLPEMGKTAQRERRACAGCERDWRPRCKCGSTTWHYDIEEIEVDAA